MLYLTPRLFQPSPLPPQPIPLLTNPQPPPFLERPGRSPPVNVDTLRPLVGKVDNSDRSMYITQTLCHKNLREENKMAPIKMVDLQKSKMASMDSYM